MNREEAKAHLDKNRCLGPYRFLLDNLYKAEYEIPQELLDIFLMESNRPKVELALSPQMYEAFQNVLLEDFERIKGHKVRYSKKNRE